MFNSGDIIGGIIGMFGGVFGSMKPLIFLLVGLFMGYWLLKKIVGIIQERAEIRFEKKVISPYITLTEKKELQELEKRGEAVAVLRKRYPHIALKEITKRVEED